MAFSIGGVPYGDKPKRDLNSDLPGKMPPVLTSFEDVRKGWRALRTAKVRLLDHLDRDMTNDINDAMIDSTGKDFHKLMQGEIPDSNIMARLIADAALVEKLPTDSSLYLEGLFLFGTSIPLIKKTTYPEMQDKERLKLAGFLYRPVNERPLPLYEKVSMLYPHHYKFPVVKILEDVLEIDDLGLRRLTMNLIESKSLKQPSDEEIEKLWNERGWTEYSKLFIKLPIDEKVMVMDVHIAFHNNPETIEYIISDVINYLSMGLPDGREERNLNRITDAAKKVMPHRQRLVELDYFNRNTTEPERYTMLQNILEGRMLL